ncbi:MAG: FAD:protein transferase [Gaiellaceae bacterium]|nr:FAD:protein transferase [Gaiellaceae bacterium]
MTHLSRFDAMGCEVLVGGATAAELEAIEELFRVREQTFSRFVPASELNRVNAAAGEFVHVSESFRRALRRALELASETGGVVDPTLGGAIESAGYSGDFELLRPDDPRPASPGAPGCWKSISVTRAWIRVPAGVRLDLNGVVKALAVDDALELLSGAGFVSAGGDLATRKPMTVALPGEGAVQLVSGAVATSGSGKRRWSRDGRIQHHLIDSRTGLPASSPWEQVTACGNTCVAADAAAKVGFLLGEAGPDYLDERGIPARFLEPDGTIGLNAAWRAAVEEPVCI